MAASTLVRPSPPSVVRWVSGDDMERCLLSAPRGRRLPKGGGAREPNRSVAINDSGARIGFPPIVRGRGSHRTQKGYFECRKWTLDSAYGGTDRCGGRLVAKDGKDLRSPKRGRAGLRTMFHAALEVRCSSPS